jgi:mycothiol system anti-sigma-R factor
MSEGVGEGHEIGAGAGGAAGRAGAAGRPAVDCSEAVHELYRYLDGELTEQRRSAIRLHLEWCGPCGSAAEFEAELRRVIASHCQDRVPESLMQRVADAIEREGGPHHGDR